MKKSVSNILKLKTSTVFLLIFLVIASIISGCTQTSPNSQNGKIQANPAANSKYNFASEFDVKKSIALKSFSNEDELKSFFSAYSASSGNYGRGVLMAESAVMKTALADSAKAPSAAPQAQPSSLTGSDYSKTNVQVQGVDEADIIKTDGEYIYTISANTLFIIKAKPAEETQIISKIKFNNSETPQNMFVNGNKLVVFGNFYDPIYFKKVGLKRNYWSMSYVYVYDITDKANPILSNDYKFDGNYLDARMINDYIYFTTIFSEQTRPIPYMYVKDVATPMAVADIYYYDIPYNYPQLLTIHSMKLDTQELKSKAIAVESTQNMYANEKNIFITYTQFINEWKIEQDITLSILSQKLSEEDKAVIEKIKNTDDDVLSKYEKDSKINQIIMQQTDFMSEDEKTALQDEVTKQVKEKLKEYTYFEYTQINKVSIENGEITPLATAKVPGHIMNQFSMDERNDVFRIATTLSQRWSRFINEAAKPDVAVAAADSKSATRGSAGVGSGASAPAQSVAAKIMPPIEPQTQKSSNNVYALDANLNVLSKLEGLAEGEQIYSTRFIADKLYMVTFRQVDPFFVIDLSDASNIKELGQLKIPGFSRYLHPYDDTKIIGIGRDATEEGRTKGIKISLFDVSDFANPKEIAKFAAKEQYSQSVAEYEHKAFLFSKEKELLVIPAYSYSYDAKDGGKENYNGAMVFKITPSDIELRGIIDHSRKGSQQYYGSMVERSLYIDNNLYTKSFGLLRVNGIENLTSIKDVELPQTEDSNYKIY